MVSMGDISVLFVLVLLSAGKYQISNALYLINVLQDLLGKSNLLSLLPCDLLLTPFLR